MKSNNEITEIQRWIFDGQEFDSLQKIKTHVENKIGKVLDSILNDSTIPPGIWLKVFDGLQKKENREKLVKYLSVTFQKELDDINSKDINILDI